jgi:prevent-host-death family protein
MGKRSQQSISAADANRRFSELLRGVRSGGSYTITSHGRPVARIVPFEQESRATTGARRVLFARLASEAIVDVGRWTRESLYEEDRR